MPSLEAWTWTLNTRYERRTNQHLLFTFSHKWCQTPINTCNKPPHSKHTALFLVIFAFKMPSFGRKPDGDGVWRAVYLSEFKWNVPSHSTQWYGYSINIFPSGQWLFRIWIHVRFRCKIYIFIWEKSFRHFCFVQILLLLLPPLKIVSISYRVGAGEMTYVFAKAKPPEMQLIICLISNFLFHSWEMRRRKRLLSDVNVARWHCMQSCELCVGVPRGNFPFLVIFERMKGRALDTRRDENTRCRLMEQNLINRILKL